MKIVLALTSLGEKKAPTAGSLSGAEITTIFRQRICYEGQEDVEKEGENTFNPESRTQNIDSDAAPILNLSLPDALRSEDAGNANTVPFLSEVIVKKHILVQLATWKKVETAKNK